MSRFPIGEYFWKMVKKGDGCWEWQGPRDSGNYGKVGASGRAHRIAWELTNGPIHDGLFVCHRCDNPPCVRPDHLFLGTAKDNVDDMIAKGRHITDRPRGFAAMGPATQKAIASKGGRAAHEKGAAHKFTSAEARIAGKRGGNRDRGRMAAIGRLGGLARSLVGKVRP